MERARERERSEGQLNRLMGRTLVVMIKFTSSAPSPDKAANGNWSLTEKYHLS